MIFLVDFGFDDFLVLVFDGFLELSFFVSETFDWMKFS